MGGCRTWSSICKTTVDIQAKVVGKKSQNYQGLQFSAWWRVPLIVPTNADASSPLCTPACRIWWVI